jgi:membrane-associated protease RseP (regulator of RpoE activity)
VGTRYEDQPVEQWAGPGSLDPTPVWKQYLIVAAFVLVALVLVVVVAYSALAVELATPPANVIGGRVVLSISDVPAAGASAKLYGAPLVDAQHAFYLVQYKPGQFIALRAAGLPDLARGGDLGVSVNDTPGGVPPPFDRYLVSVEGSKVVVNTSRVINGVEVVPAPSDPTFR